MGEVGRQRNRRGRPDLHDDEGGAINIRIPVELRHRFKTLCTLKGVTMQRRVVELMQEDVEASDGERLAMWEPHPKQAKARDEAQPVGGFGGRAGTQPSA